MQGKSQKAEIPNTSGAPVVSEHIHQISLGYIGRWDAERGDYEPTDEALIFLNNDNEQTCHVEGPNAKAMAAFIVRAVNSHDVLVKALERIASSLDLESYPDNGSVESRLGNVARAALASAREVQPTSGGDR